MSMHRTVIFIPSTALQDPATFQCTSNSPVGDPVWSTNYPPVEMRHIFCGEISNSRAQGLHSLSPATNWKTCADAQQCNYFDNGNGYCREVRIFDINKGSSTVWPPNLSPVQLVPMFQYLYNSCPPAVQDAALLCFPGCYWWDYYNYVYFDIVIGTKDDTIVTAYPAQQGTCGKHPEWKDCDSQYCQGI